MTTPLTGTEQAIQLALSSNNAADIISGVKEAVAREISILSPDADVKFTNYYNHTYMPDILMKWGRGKKEVVRPVFIRNSLRPSSIANDVRSLESESPVVLALKGTVPDVELTPVRNQARQTARVLVTDIRSLEQVSDSATGSTGEAVGNSIAASPLMRIVQGNLLQSGRGLFTEVDAENLTAAANSIQTASSQDSDSAFELFRSTANQIFSPDGVTQLVRAGRLLQSGMSRVDLSEFIELSGGKLSDTDIKIILPYLLTRDDSSSDPEFWGLLGSMVDLSVLEELPELSGIDLSRLVSPSLHMWTAKKAELVINSEYGSEEGSEAELLPDAIEHAGASVEIQKLTPDRPPNERTTWSVMGGRLTGILGPWKLVIVANDARRLSGRDGDALAADWDEVSTEASKFVLDSISLRGITRRILVSAEESGDVASDVARIRESLQENFRVTEALVRVPGSDYEESIRVDFRRMTATVERGVLPVSELGSAALSLLGHRYPIAFSWNVLEM